MFNHIQNKHKGQLGTSENLHNNENSQSSRFFESAWTKMMKKSQYDQSSEKRIKNNSEFDIENDKNITNQSQTDKSSDETVKNMKSVKNMTIGLIG